MKRTNNQLNLFALTAFFLAGMACGVHADLALGPLAHTYESTLQQGLRQEFFGPLLYRETYETNQAWGIPFLFNRIQNQAIDSDEWDFIYPLLGYDRVGEEYRIQLLQIVTAHGGKEEQETSADRLAIFPFYFHQRSDNPENNYTAFLPFYGNMKGRFLRDEIDFVLWPLYVKTRKHDLITRNYLAPIFHYRTGESLQGWQVWPLVGWESKGVTKRQLLNKEKEIIGGHRRLMLLWPFFFQHQEAIGTTNPKYQGAFIPFYSYERSPNRDSTTVPWPLGLTVTHDREKQFREYGMPWPMIVWAEGEGKHTRRVWPLFGYNHNASLRSDFLLWPLYRYRERMNSVTTRTRHQLLAFLYSHVEESNNATKETTFEQWHFWPFFTKYKNNGGDRRFQALALLEPILPGNESVERNYSHAWSVWRSETNGTSGKSSHSLLWNLYRYEKTETSKKVSFLFGLFQCEQKASKDRYRIFFVPFNFNKPTS
ncbi:MAG: hypothetical protein HOH33_07795 [Verrucomicrobia bacterium]|nr:hypothetical protein [Verrucomicrobiota bacterium]